MQQLTKPTSEDWNRLWPNRVHESDWLKSLACAVGLHRWRRFQIGDDATAPSREFCRWCSKTRQKS